MKRLFIGAFGAFMLAVCAVAAEGSGVQTVYILPMSGGLDLYLAQWLTHSNAVRVTADPKRADAILTDRLGVDFERKLDEIVPQANDDEDSDPPPSQHYGAGHYRGTIFLVDAKTRQVLWSDYEKPPAYRTPASLNHQGEKIAKKLTSGLLK